MAKEHLSMAIRCLAITSVVATAWLLFVYHVAFQQQYPWVRDFSLLFLQTKTEDTLSANIPLTIFVLYQVLFVFILPLLILSAFSQQIHIVFLLWFAALWLIFVYSPLLLLTHLLFSFAHL
jgi:Amt family ammonium transporter